MWDVSQLPDPDDEPFALGELMYAGEEAGTSITHVRSTAAGGYVDILTRAEYAAMQTEEVKQERRKKAQKEKARRKRRELTVGAARRRWVWQNGKPGGMGKGVGGPERRRDEKGRFVRQGL